MITRIGACLVPEPATADRPAVAPPESYAALRTDFLTSLARVTSDLGQMFPEPDKFAPELTDGHVNGFANAGIANYLNPSNAPAWASGGLPAYQPAVGGSAAWWLATQVRMPEAAIREIFRKARETEDPESALRAMFPGIADSHVWNFVKHYRLEQTKTGAWNEPMREDVGNGGWHTVGAKGHEVADAISAPRDFALHPETVPHLNPRFTRMAGQKIGEHFGPDRVQLHGVGNEFGNDQAWLPIRYDGANFKGGEDMVVTRIYPEWIEPYFTGLINDANAKAVRIVIGEHDGLDIFRRFLQYELDHGLGHGDYVSVHPYPTSNVERVAEFLAVAASFGIGPERVMLSEIRGEEIADWLDQVLTRWPTLPAICFLAEQWQAFYKDWWKGSNGLELTETGTDVRAVIHYHARRRRAVGK